jgi:hypothetical protein
MDLLLSGGAVKGFVNEICGMREWMLQTWFLVDLIS